jgi:hypothetical protein
MHPCDVQKLSCGIYNVYLDKQTWSDIHRFSAEQWSGCAHQVTSSLHAVTSWCPGRVANDEIKPNHFGSMCDAVQTSHCDSHCGWRGLWPVK